MKVIFHNVKLSLIAGVHGSLHLPNVYQSQRIILRLDYYPTMHPTSIIVEAGKEPAFKYAYFTLDLHGHKKLVLADIKCIGDEGFRVSELRFTSKKDCILFVSVMEIAEKRFASVN
jgi:hypothetical protein